MIKWLDTIDSTNAEVWRRIGELETLSVVAARCQTAGRGQRGNTWTAAAGENLTFSILLRHPATHLHADSAGLLSETLTRVNYLAALAVHDYLVSRGIDALIKWPNDIYVGRRKICGILVENRLIPDRESHSVVGIGINVNQTAFPPELINPVSMRTLTGRTYDLDAELEAFLQLFQELYPSVTPTPAVSPSPSVTPDGPSVTPDASSVTPDLIGSLSDPLRERYEAALFQKGLPCPYRDLSTGEEFTGTILGVAPDGRLRVARTAGGGQNSDPRPAKTAQNAGEGQDFYPLPAKMTEKAAIGLAARTSIKLYGFKEISYIL